MRRGGHKVHIAADTLGRPLPSAVTVLQVTPTISPWPMSTRGQAEKEMPEAGLQHNILRCRTATKTWNPLNRGALA
jgi:hypothetical protein